MNDWLVFAVTASSAAAAIASAVYAHRTHEHAKALSIRDLRLETEDLNRTLNEQKEMIRKVHATRLRNLKASASFLGTLYSSGTQLLEGEWTNDGIALEAAISLIDTPERTYGDLDEHQLEAKLLNLKSIKRQYEYELMMGKEWEEDGDRVREWVSAKR